MNNPEPSIGDIWLWCGRTHILVLDWDEDENCWLALNMKTGIVGHWELDVNGDPEGEDWEFMA